MSDRHWPWRALAASALALMAAAAVAGCSGSAGQSQASATQQATAQGTYSGTQLRDALLTKINGQSPATPAEAGDYGSLPDVRSSKQTLRGVKVAPAKCAQTSTTGFNSPAFAHAPASLVTFRLGRDGVSEVLISTSPQVAATAVGERLPAGCAHYSATVKGKTYLYTVRESSLSGLAEQARAMNVRVAGYPSVDVWSVVYRATGFVGSVTMVGPDASERVVKSLAQDAYAHASQALSQH